MTDESTKLPQPRMGLPPHWLDDVIREGLNRSADAAGVAHAIAENPRFIEAINAALDRQSARDPAAVQAIRRDIINAMLAAR